MGLSLKRLKKEIARLDPSVKDGDHTHTTYLILLSSLACGPNVNKIAKYAGIPRASVRKRAVNLRKNGVWRGAKVYANWFDKDGGCAFILDACVADGLMERGK